MLNFYHRRFDALSHPALRELKRQGISLKINILIGFFSCLTWIGKWNYFLAMNDVRSIETFLIQ